MSKYEDLPPGFTTIQQVEGGRYISYCTDNDFWEAIYNGYKLLFDAGFSSLLKVGANDKEADNAGVLYQFMEELGKELKNK